MEIRVQIDVESFKKLFKQATASRRAKLGVLALTALPLALYAAAKPHTFTDGNAISAAQVNENFDTVYTAVTKLETQTYSTNFKYTAINNDYRLNSQGSWQDIPQRSLSYTKLRSSSLVRISYQDTLGTYGTHYDQCRWRILFNGTQVLYFSAADITYGTNWRMQNATHTVIVPGQATGTYTIKVQNYNNGASECLSGWNTVGSYLSAEEIGG